MNTMTEVDAMEQRALAQCCSELSSLKTTHPNWYAELDDVDPDICPRSDLVELMNTAPTPAARGYLLGKFTMRIAVSTITGRPFV